MSIKLDINNKALNNFDFSVNIVDGLEITYEDGKKYNTKNPMITVPVSFMCSSAIIGGTAGAFAPIYLTSLLFFKIGRKIFKR